MENAVFGRRSDDQPCVPVEGELDKPALLRWLNRRPEFSTGRFVVRDVLLAGQPTNNQHDLRLYLALHHPILNLVTVSPFEFSYEAVAPFIQPPVSKSRAIGQ